MDFIIDVLSLLGLSFDLQQRIKALESAKGTSVESLIQRISYYGGRRVEDFEKYEALRYAEELASVAKSSSHPKAASYDDSLRL